MDYNLSRNIKIVYRYIHINYQFDDFSIPQKQHLKGKKKGQKLKRK